MLRLSCTTPMLISLADDELIVDENAMIGSDDKDVATCGDDGVFRARHHLPVHHDSVLQGVDSAYPETMAAIADILLVRACDALLQRIEALDFPASHVVDALRRPECSDAFAAYLWIGLVPDGDVALRQLFSFVHDKLSLDSGCLPGPAAPWTRLCA